MPVQPAPNRYLSIHYLRAIAALMVVAFHCFTTGLVPVENLSDARWLKQGIAIFFVISGFVMVASTKERTVGPVGFMRRRIVRIVPLYWLMTLGLFAGLADRDFAHLLGSLAFLPSPDPVSGTMRSPVLSPGWTLNFEMLFYCVFALALLVPERARFWTMAVSIGVFSQAGAWIELPAYLDWFSRPLLLLFVAGMAIARWDMRLPAWFVPAGFCALALLPNWSSDPYLSIQLPAVAIVLGGRSLDRTLREWRLPSALADASYAIYLSHLFVLQQCAKLLPPMLPGPATLIAAIVLSALYGIVIHRLIEVPVTGMCKRWLDGNARKPIETGTAAGIRAR